MFLKRFMPTEGRFFDLFNESAEQIVTGSRELQAMLTELSKLEYHAKNVKDIEHKADEITHRTIELLHKTFITPMDREDIHSLICSMDEILDFMDAAAQRAALFGITRVYPEAAQMAEVCVKSALEVQKAVRSLEDLKNPDAILKLCVEIHRLENEGDFLLRNAIARLFKEESDVRELIKQKEIYELLEAVTDRCEEVANIIEGIVLEYA
jgi:predicted phosphate transport protein (TIGR00153 family)